MNNFRQFQATLIFVAEKHPPEMRENLLEIAEMDRSGAKKFSLILGGGGFSATKTKVAQNCLNWIDLMSKNFPSSLGGGGFSATKTKVAWNCLKWIDLMSKNFLLSWRGGGLFCHKNQSCYKLPEMDRSGVKKFSLILGGGAFLPQKLNCSELPEFDRSGVKNISLILWGGGNYSATKPKLLKIAWNG